jgi:hypothetical protein
MLQGICIDHGQTVVLEKGKSYFLFPNGTQHYYVSNFPNKNAHKGCFQTQYFQIIEKEKWPLEPEIKNFNLDPEKVYRAKLIWRKPGYKFLELKEYFVKQCKTHVDFYHNSSLKEYGGCFPLHWFTNLVEVQQEEIVQEISNSVIKSEENDLIPIESDPKTIKYIQLSFFD